MRDYPVIGWLLLAVAVAVLHTVVPHSTWLLVHLLMLGAATHSILVWSAYFAQALLKTPDRIDDRAAQNRRLWVLVVGTAVVLVGVPTSLWPVTAVGATLVATAVTWHGIQLYRRLRTALPMRFRVTIHYYLAAVAWLGVGATVGPVMATEPGDAWMGRLLLAHTMALGLGWIGLTVTGTLVTLWPTMLRTRMDDRAEALARQALPGFVGALVIVDAAAVLGLRWVVVAGLVGYGAALLWWGRALSLPARRRPPHQFSTISLAAGMVWYLVALPVVALAVVRMPDWAHLEHGYAAAVAAVVGGFVQVLIGAMAYLVPAAVGGGPSAVRTAHLRLDRIALPRIVALNAGLVGLVLAPSGPVRMASFALTVAAVAAFIGVLVWAGAGMAAARRHLDERIGAEPSQRTPEEVPLITSVWSIRGIVVALALVAVVDLAVLVL